MMELTEKGDAGKPGGLFAAEAEAAFEAYSALRKAACAEPHLTQNGYFRALQDTAYARFLMFYEASK